MKILEHRLLLFMVRLLLGSIFIYASWDKILYPAQFAQAVSNYKILPLLVVNLFAITLPWVEVIAGLSLILGVYTRGSALVITSLLFLFVVAAVISVYRNLDISCGCFDTSGGRRVGIMLILEDSSLLLLGFWILVKEKGARVKVARRNP